MSRMPRILLFAALCVLPSIASGPIGSSAIGDDQKPAPAEPSGGNAATTLDEATDLGEATTLDESTDDAGSTDEAEQPERFERSTNDDKSPPPIVGTEPKDASAPKMTNDGEFDVQAAFDTLRQDIESRMGAIEKRLDQQITRLDDLETTDMKIAAAAGQTTTPGEPVMSRETEDTAAAATAAHDKAIARLRADFDEMRADYDELLAAMDGASDGTDSANVLGNSQPGPGRQRSVRYRLRIHNSTGAEQPISVNGVQWTVRADEWTFLPIPAGPVTVHRPGFDPLEITEDQIDWQSDSRGFYVNYDYKSNESIDPSAG